MKKVRKLTRAMKIAKNKAGNLSVNSKYAQKKRAERRGNISPKSPFYQKTMTRRS